MVVFIITIYTNTWRLWTFPDMRLNMTLGTLLTLYITSKFKQLHDLIVGRCWSMNEFVIVVIHLEQKLKYIIHMFSVHPFAFFPQNLR